MTEVMYVNGQEIGRTTVSGRVRLAEQFVLDLIEVDRNNVMRWNVVRERTESDTGGINA